jgi:glycosyltransferase involved in cell wall biosynthesis
MGQGLKSMSTNQVYLQKEKIYIFCFGFKKDRDIEAIKKEARTNYQYYKRNRTDIDFKFISLESDLEENEEVYDKEFDVYYWGYNFYNLISNQNPRIVHIFADSIEGYYLFEKNYKVKRFITLYTITGIDGFREYDESYLQHLLHAIDVGNLFLFVESVSVKTALTNSGLKSILVHPQVDLQRSKLVKTKNLQYTIGFASAPLDKEAWTDRGIYFLVSIMKQLCDFQFKVAWRGEFYAEFIALLEENDVINCEVHNGYLDMYEFYKDVDAMIAPFMSLKNNHSSPLSIIESVALAMPVVVTNLVGIHELISQHQFGVVAQNNTEDMVIKINELREKHSYYQKNTEEFGLNLFDIRNTRNSYLKYYDEIKFQANSPTLDQWRSQLNNENKYLVMDRVGMAEYYNDSFIADNYDESRFSKYPMRTYDMLERKAIAYQVEKYKASDDAEIDILDVASGDGRILRELLRFGKVTAVENSAFMISVSSRKLPGSNVAEYVESDFFEFQTEQKYDVITIFRFIRHFNYIDRIKIYEKLSSLLNRDGIIIADFPNKQTETQLRSYHRWASFNVYDVFWNDFEIFEELNDNGFKILDKIPIGEHLMSKGDRINDELPLSRVVCFCKK